MQMPLNICNLSETVVKAAYNRSVKKKKEKKRKKKKRREHSNTSDIIVNCKHLWRLENGGDGRAKGGNCTAKALPQLRRLTPWEFLRQFETSRTVCTFLALIIDRYAAREMRKVRRRFTGAKATFRRCRYSTKFE
ncbi:hypothetical protein PUN28_008085 [Cardiocondyla obscurior]|uniref:Uncharacterized protein n=1 Tax=Cardiocondyla obscurior TaxID=286306 RepID=A0AAW2FXL5_9HYME